MADTFGLAMNDAYDIFQSLGVGEAIYKCADRPGPFRIEVPLAPVPDKCDEDKRKSKVEQFLRDCCVDSGPAWEGVHKEIAKTRASKVTTLNDNDIRLLRESAVTYERPLPLKDLAAKVGIGASEATYSSRRLEQLGYVERQEDTIARNRLVFLEPTQKGWNFLGLLRPDGAGRGNAPHRYCVTLCEHLLKKKGYDTHREVERNGKRIDLVGEKGGTTIFVENEMTPKNSARNAVADLAVAGPEVKQIAVVCPTEAVLKQVRKAVESAIDAQSLKRFAFKVVSAL
jgi:DNA-binding MarR family transcriptional regulator